MKEHARNIIVGLTVLLALAGLAGLVLLFAGVPQIIQTGRTIYIRMPTSGGVREGDAVHIAGLRVGRIMDISHTDPQNPVAGVTFTARIEGEVPIPPESVCVVYRDIMGRPHAAIEPPQQDGKRPVDYDRDEPLVIHGMVKDQIDTLIRKWVEPAEHLSSLMASLNRTAYAIETGEGTFGKLARDPQLYDSMVSATRQLNEVLIRFSVLVDAWKKQGVELKIK